MTSLPTMGAIDAPEREGLPAIRVLGPITANGPRGPVVFEGVRQRTLLGALALRAGTALSERTLVAALWGEEPPRTAIRTLHSHVARIRRALLDVGFADVVVRRAPGYALAVPPDDVDACRFDALVRQAQIGSPDESLRDLTAALRLWHGEPLADAEPHSWAADEARRLVETRFSASERLWQTRLERGEHAEAIDELSRLVFAAPTRERMVGLLMLALYRCGRQAEALERYERTRATLADELGIDPGPDLQRLHTAMLRRESYLDAPVTATATVTAQLPHPVGHFTGRQAELSSLNGWLESGSDEPRLALIRGLAGIGKTAFGVRWAHEIKHAFPDGQVFIDLRGHDPEQALSPTDGLLAALRSLGIPDSHLPIEHAALVGIYQNVISGRRVLLFLDNAGTTDQVLPLVPPVGGAVMLVTSRTALTGLDLHHAVHRVDLDVLSTEDCLTLLSRVIGKDRVNHESDAATELTALCDRMPLPLRIAAAKLAGRRRQRIADLVAELNDGGERLGVLALEGAPSLRAVFATTLNALSDPAIRLFRLLGLHPGIRFTSHAAAAVAGSSVGRARRVIDELIGAHLLTEDDDGTFRFHDLLRLYAVERAREAPDEVAEAAGRLVDWYTAIAHAANRILDPRRDRIAPSPRYQVEELPFGDQQAEVLAFLDLEHANLVSVVSWAAENGHGVPACELVYLLAGYYESRGYLADRIAICRIGVAAAQRLRDPSTEALMRSALGVALISGRGYSQALPVLEAALELAESSQDMQAASHLHNNMAVAHANLREFDKAAESFARALSLYTAHQPAWVPVGLNNLGSALAQAGDMSNAIAHLSDGLKRARDVDDPRIESLLLQSLGEAYDLAGQPTNALASFEAALAIRRRTGSRPGEAESLLKIGETRLRLADRSALDSLHLALDLYRSIGDRHMQAVVLVRVAQARLAAGQRAEAAAALAEAVEIRTRYPDPAEEETIKRLTAGSNSLASPAPSASDHRPRSGG